MASDITYLRANGRFYYLCVILDLFSRMVVAWKLSPSIDQNLTLSCVHTVDYKVTGKGENNREGFRGNLKVNSLVRNLLTNAESLAGTNRTLLTRH